jgi:dihydrofolate reductase
MSLSFIYIHAPTSSRIEDTVVKTNSVDAACAYTPSPSSPLQIDRRFIIGGAELYQHALTSSQTLYTLDRILLTRVLEPEFPECDVFLPEFRSAEQIAAENAGSPLAETTETNGSHQWRRAAHKELSSWVGFNVPSGIQEEKGVKYQFQMWVRESELN